MLWDGKESFMEWNWNEEKVEIRPWDEKLEKTNSDNIWLELGTGQIAPIGHMHMGACMTN